EAEHDWVPPWFTSINQVPAIQNLSQACDGTVTATAASVMRLTRTATAQRSGRELRPPPVGRRRNLDRRRHEPRQGALVGESGRRGNLGDRRAAPAQLLERTR